VLAVTNVVEESGMEVEDLSTRERILHEAIDLISENGFKDTTVKDIAVKAAVSEMTVFRHFKTKSSILDEAIQRFSFEIPIKKDVENKITWELEKDLRLFTTVYHKFTSLNEKVLIIKFKEGQKAFTNDIVESPRQLKKFLVEYFEKMQDLGKMVETDSELQAIIFIYMNFGFFCSKILGNERLTDKSFDDFLNGSVKLFARGIAP
jgi:AcrR family transcriptional regulator